MTKPRKQDEESTSEESAKKEAALSDEDLAKVAGGVGVAPLGSASASRAPAGATLHPAGVTILNSGKGFNQ